jgi:hypothetical protein
MEPFVTRFSIPELHKRRTDAAWRFWYAWTIDTPSLRKKPPTSESDLDRFIAKIAAKELERSKAKSSICWTSINNARHGNTDLGDLVINALESALNRRLDKSRRRVGMKIFGMSYRKESDKVTKKPSAKNIRTVVVRTKPDSVLIKLPAGYTSARLHETRKRRGGSLEIEIRLSHR